MKIKKYWLRASSHVAQQKGVIHIALTFQACANRIWTFFTILLSQKIQEENHFKAILEPLCLAYPSDDRVQSTTASIFFIVLVWLRSNLVWVYSLMLRRVVFFWRPTATQAWSMTKQDFSIHTWECLMFRMVLISL